MDAQMVESLIINGGELSPRILRVLANIDMSELGHLDPITRYNIATQISPNYTKVVISGTQFKLYRKVIEVHGGGFQANSPELREDLHHILLRTSPNGTIRYTRVRPRDEHNSNWWANIDNAYDRDKATVICSSNSASLNDFVRTCLEKQRPYKIVDLEYPNEPD